MHHSYDLICLSHLRWDFVYQRPQHLLGRCARERRVFFVEEPAFGPGPARLDVSLRESDNVFVVVPHLPEGIAEPELTAMQQALLDVLLSSRQIKDYVLWYYTPMALSFSRHLAPRAVVYDCMDELSAFKGAPAAMQRREAELMRRAEVMFTGGHSLFEAKRDKHPNVHAFPSSVDTAHFARARSVTEDPPDQAAIPHPRVGFFGVIDERMDLELLAAVAEARPDLQLVMLGPVVKIDPASLPRHANIHWLGGKSYAELPAYIAGWDVTMLPFARNDSTRFISPTKTPEYLAAGKPVVSTTIRDVVKPYGEEGLCHIADTPDEFIQAIEAALAEDAAARLEKADAMLARTSWDLTWSRMRALIDAAVAARGARRAHSAAALSQPLSTPSLETVGAE